MELPNIARTKQEEKESFRIIEEALGKDFILRKQNESDDYGIDAEIELIHDGYATGKIIKIQVKSSLDLEIRKKDSVPTVSGIKQSTLNYWIATSDYAHVVIFAVDLTHKDIYITYPIFLQATQLIDGSTQTKTIEFQKRKLFAPELGKVLRLFLLFPHPKEELKQYQQLQRDIKRYINLWGEIHWYDLQCQFDWETMESFVELFETTLFMERFLCKGKPPKYLLDKKTPVGDLIWTKSFWKSLQDSDYPNLFAREPFSYLISILLERMNSYRDNVLSARFYWARNNRAFLRSVFQMPFFYEIPKERKAIIDFWEKSEEFFDTAKTKGDEDFYSYIQSLKQSSNGEKKQ